MKNATRIEMSALEARVLLCADHGGAAAGLTVFPAGSTGSGSSGGTSATVSMTVPAYASRANAKATLFLDFDGDGAGTWGSFDTTASQAYTQDSNAGFCAGELNNIKSIWSRVAEKFSPFDLNVTTVQPASGTKFLRVVVGGDGSWYGAAVGGLSYVNSFASGYANRTAYVFAQNLGNGYAKYVAEAVAHESGHAFGLQHQSVYSGGTKTNEYNPGSGSLAPVMGNSYGSVRGNWWSGSSSDSSNSTQDDMSILAGSANGFGYRADDMGNSLTSYRTLKINNNAFAAKGIIEKTSDRDYFAFTLAVGGTITIKVSANSYGGMLDARVKLFKSNGTCIKTADSGLSETITISLSAGTYKFAVMSHGSYGDVGQYTVNGNATSVGNSPAASPAIFSNVKIANNASGLI